MSTTTLEDRADSEPIEKTWKDYAELDIGELYQILNDYEQGKIPEQELDNIRTASVNLGHYDLLERTYGAETKRALERVVTSKIASGLGEDYIDLRDFDIAFVNQDYETMLEICYNNGVVFSSPSAKEIEWTLYRAVTSFETDPKDDPESKTNRGRSIDDTGTSVGSCYQTLFGRDYFNMQFERFYQERDVFIGVRGEGVERPFGVYVGSYSEEVPLEFIPKSSESLLYSQLSPADKERVNYGIVRAKLEALGFSFN